MTVVKGGLPKYNPAVILAVVAGIPLRFPASAKQLIVKVVLKVLLAVVRNYPGVAVAGPEQNHIKVPVCA